MTRETQEQPRPVAVGDGLDTLIAMIEGGEEPQRVYDYIVEAACNTPCVAAAGLYLTSERPNELPKIIATSASFPVEHADEILSQLEDSTEGTSMLKLDVTCLGAPIGALVIIGSEQISERVVPHLRTLAHHAATVFERSRLSATLQHFLDRIQVFNELNQLIVGKVGLPRLVKTLTRDAAFRFGAELSLTFMLSEDRNTVLLDGVFGCPAAEVPGSIDATEGIIGQVLRLGGHLSVSDLNKVSANGLPFLGELGATSIEICCLEVHGEILGVLLLAFRNETTFNSNELTRFEEFCQGAAVAISNARTQERLRTHTERLAELVESKTKDLQVQTKVAEEANQAKSRFLANMSHELRTPLTAIVGYGSILTDGIFGPLNDKQQDALVAIVRSSEHLKSLIDDVLNLARIESGKENAEPTRVALGEALNQAHRLMLQQAITKGVTIKAIEIPEPLLKECLFVDGKHINQIIINLMSNAVKYTPQGGKVWLSAELVGDMVRINIHDTGVGLSPQKVERLFERFERGEDTYSKHQEGTGIGLNLTKHLVELNGGRIGVESVVGQGSTFWLLLPRASAEQFAVVESERSATNPRLDGLHALVVDDNPDTLAVLKTVLESSGAIITTANSVPDAREKFKGANFDIVLTDLAMPGESGLALISHIRDQESGASGIPVIVLSACAFENDKQSALEAGASMFIPKPFRPTEIIRGVRQATVASAMRSKR